MASESGEALDAILLRKERERILCGGIFHWGVGSPPSRLIPGLAASSEDIPIIFSKMVSKARIADTNPSAVYVWHHYVDHLGRIKSLPQESLVTSKSSGNYAKKHYALVCKSDSCITFDTSEQFDPSAYVNAAGNNGMVAPSQVTALLKKVRTESYVSKYQANIKAKLVEGLWVRLMNPSEIPRNLIDNLLPKLSSNRISNAEWIDIVQTLKKAGAKNVSLKQQIQHSISSNA